MSVIVRAPSGRLTSRMVRGAPQGLPDITPTDFWFLQASVSYIPWADVQRVSIYVARDETLVGADNDNNNPAWSSSGTLFLSVVNDSLVRVTYNGIVLQVALPEPMLLRERWFPWIRIIENDAEGSPFAALDDFACDSFSDSFNRADYTLYTEPSKPWEPGTGWDANIWSNEVKDIGTPPDPLASGGVAWWDGKTDNRDVTNQIYIRNIRAPSGDPESFESTSVYIGLISYSQAEKAWGWNTIT